MKKLLLFGISTALLTGCGLGEMMEKTTKMTEIIQVNCDCDDVRLLNYNDNMTGTVTAYFEIVGADVEKHEDIARTINSHLKQGIPDYCGVDELTLDFINKGEHNQLVIENCELQSEE